MKTFLSIFIFLIAIACFLVLTPFGVIYGIVVLLFRESEKGEPNMSKYFYTSALAIDQALNVILLFPLNDLMRKPGGAMHGNPDETISGVTGKNQLSKKLTWFGLAVNWFLNKLDRNHSIKAIENDEQTHI